MLPARWCEDYVMRIRVRGAGNYASGRLETRMDLLDGTSTPYAYDPGDDIKFAHGYMVQKNSKEGDVFVAQFTNRQCDDLFQNPDTLKAIEFLKLQWITTQLQEMTVEFQPRELGLQFTPDRINGRRR